MAQEHNIQIHGETDPDSPRQNARIDRDHRTVAMIVGGGTANLATIAMAMAREGYQTSVVQMTEADIEAARDGIDVLVGGPPCSIEPMGVERPPHGSETNARGAADGTPVLLVIDETMDRYGLFARRGEQRDEVSPEIAAARRTPVGYAGRRVELGMGMSAMADIGRMIRPMRDERNQGAPKQNKAEWRRSMKGGGKSRKL